MKFSANLTLEGQEEPVLVESRPADIMAWEARTKRKITDGMGYSDMLQIIYSAAKRSGVTDRPFTDFVDDLVDFDPIAPDEVGPTKTGQPTIE